MGPPGTGKTDVAVQIISNIYHNFPEQRTLIVTHSNQVRERERKRRWRGGRGSEAQPGKGENMTTHTHVHINVWSGPGAGMHGSLCNSLVIGKQNTRKG